MAQRLKATALAPYLNRRHTDAIVNLRGTLIANPRRLARGDLSVVVSPLCPLVIREG